VSDSRAGVASADLALLLRAPALDVREAAWDRLIAGHTRLLLAVARSFGGDADEAMERYAFILGKCRERDCRRLRAFDVTGRASFATWLTVAARRLCIDHERARHGRRRVASQADALEPRPSGRRPLLQAIASELDVELMPDEGASPDDATLRSERLACLQDALARLTARERLLLALRFDDGLSASRIAGVLGSPTVFHVYRQLNGALGSLRSMLVTRGIDGVE
jgi:RNA polymerase sigma factor (sigma-70 family)